MAPPARADGHAEPTPSRPPTSPIPFVTSEITLARRRRAGRARARHTAWPPATPAEPWMAPGQPPPRRSLSSAGRPASDAHRGPAAGGATARHVAARCVDRRADRPRAAGRVLRRARAGRGRRRAAGAAPARHRRRQPAALPEAAGDPPSPRRSRGLRAHARALQSALQCLRARVGGGPAGRPQRWRTTPACCRACSRSGRGRWTPWPSSKRCCSASRAASCSNCRPTAKCCSCTRWRATCSTARRSIRSNVDLLLPLADGGEFSSTAPSPLRGAEHDGRRRAARRRTTGRRRRWTWT